MKESILMVAELVLFTIFFKLVIMAKKKTEKKEVAPKQEKVQILKNVPRREKRNWYISGSYKRLLP